MLNTTRQTPREATGRSETEYFLGKLREEARRSLRYNPLFSVAVLRTRRTIPEALYRRLRPHLRSTDLVEVVNDGINEHTRGPSLSLRFS
jgi:hypothetical protein